MKTARCIYILIILFTLSNCVQETHLKTIHFRVDMNGIENPSNVGIRGEFGSNYWNETYYFSDENDDGIYEGIVTVKTGQSGFLFKFVNHNDQFELSGQNNRRINFEYKPETITYVSAFNNNIAEIKVTN